MSKYARDGSELQWSDAICAALGDLTALVYSISLECASQGPEQIASVTPALRRCGTLD